MAVDPTKARKILIVHGVQTGTDDDQDQHETISELVKNRLGSIPLDFKAEMYRYENINDAAQKKFKRVIKLIAKTPVGGIVAGSVIDLVGDVVISLKDGATAEKIRKGLKQQIMDCYKAGNPCYIVAHSLGSIYTFDVINELITEDGIFDRNSRKTWPVQGLLTLGSPIGLPMFRTAGRKKVSNLGSGTKRFRWINFWDRTDPIVSGNIFGKRLPGFDIAEKYQSDSLDQGWVIRDKSVDTGKVWLAAHVSYWDNPIVGDVLVDMITN